MPKVSPEDDPSYVPNVVYEVPMKLKPSNVLIGVIAGAVIIAIGVIGALIILYGFQSDTSSNAAVTTTNTSKTTTSTPSAQKSQTANWETYKNTKYGYLIKYPKGWYESTETKVVSEENNIVYHFYAVAKDKNQISGTTDQVMIVRYLEGDPCAQMEIKKVDVTVSGHKGQRSDCYGGDQIKVIVLSFPNTNKEEWFVVAYVDEELDLIEEIISNIKFLD